MSLTEQILIRWIAAVSAAVSAASGALLAFEDIDETVLIVLAVIDAVLAALVIALTTDAGSRALGVARPRRG